MAEAEGALTAPWEDESKDSTGYSDPIKNTLAGGFGGICLVAAGKLSLLEIFELNSLGLPVLYFHEKYFRLPSSQPMILSSIYNRSASRHHKSASTDHAIHSWSTAALLWGLGLCEEDCL